MSIAPAAPSGFNPMALAGQLWRRAPIIAAMLLCGAALGCVVARSLPPRYSSSVSILIDPKRPGSFGADATFANLYVDSNKIASVELILVSSAVVDRVVRAEHLADLPEYGDPRPSLVHRLLPFLGGGEAEPEPDTPEAREGRALDRLTRAIRTQRIGMTYVIKVDVTAPSPELAYRLSQAVAAAYLQDQVDTKYEAAVRDSEWLGERLKKLRSDSFVSEDAVEAVRQKYGLAETDGGPGSTVGRQTLTEINSQLAQADGDVAARTARHQQAEQVRRSGGDLQSLPEVAASKVIESLRDKQSNADRVVSDLAARFTPNYAPLIAARRDSEAISRQIASEVSRIVDGLRNEAQSAVARRDALRSQLAQLVDGAGATGGAAGRIKLREAQQIADVNRAVYEATLNRLREVEQQQTREEVEARIISPASSPAGPSPKPAIVIAGGAGGGLFAGIGLAFLLIMLDSRVVSVAAAEQSVSLPVLARIPLLRRADLAVGRDRFTVLEYLSAKPLSHYGESLRALRVSMQIKAQQPGKVVQVTSAVEGEGKSITAASLAASAAAAGVRTVLVDLDLYNPSVSGIFGLEPQCGIADVLAGTAHGGAVLQRHCILPLRIIGGRFSACPRPETLEGPQFKLFVQELRRTYELVVLDTPPVLAVSDPLIICAAADAVVVVAAWRSTPQGVVKEAVDKLRAARAPLAGLILNKVDQKQIGGYGSYASLRNGYRRA